MGVGKPTPFFNFKNKGDNKMAGNRFSFVTYSDDNNGCVVKSDDQKNKKADGSGVVDGKLIFTCPVEFRKEVTGITATPKLVFGAEKTMEWSKCSSVRMARCQTQWKQCSNWCSCICY